ILDRRIGSAPAAALPPRAPGRPHAGGGAPPPARGAEAPPPRAARPQPRRPPANAARLPGVAGVRRHWLAEAGERVGRLRAQIPVSLHHRDEDAAELGNRDSFLNLDLPLPATDRLR